MKIFYTPAAPRGDRYSAVANAVQAQLGQIEIPLWRARETVKRLGITPANLISASELVNWLNAMDRQRLWKRLLVWWRGIPYRWARVVLAIAAAGGVVAAILLTGE